MPRVPTKPDAANPAMTLQVHAGSKWSRVADLERWLSQIV
jgi:hypothetical protein